jgi:hypothetical protein
MSTRHKWQRDYYGQLVGATIEACAIEPNTTGYGGGDDGWPTFLVRTRDGHVLKLEISQDEEGNGPGFIFIGDADGARVVSGGV